MSFDDIESNYLDKFDIELSWRKKELLEIQNELESLNLEEDEQKYNFFKRGAIALTYAHLEGGVKNILIIYVKFINELLLNQIISLNENNINDIILDLIFYNQVKVFRQNSREKRLKGLNNCKRFFMDNQLLKIDIKLIDTKSNLTFNNLNELYKLLDINLNNISIQKTFINQLVKRRNAIAHGENTSDTREIVIDNIKQVLEILDLVRDDIIHKIGEFKNICN